MPCMRRQFFLSLLLALFLCARVGGQEAVERDVVVHGKAGEFDEPGDYGQPEWAERSQASSTTKLYVLSAYEVFVGLFSESDFDRNGRPTHDLRQEIEIGLPHRFEVGFENRLEVSGRDAAETMASLEGRYAFGAWNAIPLNPAIAASYKFGLGDVPKVNDHSPDACEVSLLVGQEFVPRLQWALNLFFQQDLGAPHNREAGFTQDVTYLAVADKLELGAEMRYTYDTHKFAHHTAANEFVIGPSVSWRPNKYTVLDLAPLFGCTGDSPDLALFATLSFEFGGAESKPTGAFPAPRER
jgi:hypothetical protein